MKKIVLSIALLGIILGINAQENKIEATERPLTSPVGSLRVQNTEPLTQWKTN